MAIGSPKMRDVGDGIHDVARKKTVPGQPTWVIGNGEERCYTCAWWGSNRKSRPSRADNAYCGYVLQIMGLKSPASLSPETFACPRYEFKARRKTSQKGSE